LELRFCVKTQKSKINSTILKLECHTEGSWPKGHMSHHAKLGMPSIKAYISSRV